MPSVTILTTTYNRSSLLQSCYESLIKQTLYDFEWVIIDDGSTDDTKTVVDSFSQDLFSITYVSQVNMGKHVALNNSHDYINGKYVLFLDDDDVLSTDAIENCIEVCDKYADNQNIWCISFQRENKNGVVLQDWEYEEIISNHIDFRINQNRVFDCAEVVKSDLFKTYTFPVFINEKFIGEDCMWTYMAFQYDTVYVRKPIYITEYRQDGLTMSGRKMRLNNPQGGLYRSNMYLNKRFQIRIQIKHACLYNAFSFAEHDIIKGIKKSNNKIMCLLTMPVGLLLYLKWNKLN